MEENTLYNEQILGIIAGNIVMLSIIYSLYAVNSPRNTYIAAILAVLLTDPLSHLYSLNVASKKKYYIGLKSFYSQIVLQLIVLILFLIKMDINMTILLVTIINIITTVYFLNKEHQDNNNIFKIILGIFTIVFITYLFNKNLIN